MWRVLAVTALLVACAPSPQVSVTLYQTRSDTPLEKVEIQVRNSGDTAIAVEHAQLHSSRLEGSPAWDEPVRIPAGAAVDLKIDLPPPNCHGAAGESVVLVVNGRQMVLDAPDVLGQVGAYVTQACFEQQVEATASIWVTDVRENGIRVRVDPGSARIGSLDTTILFKPVDPDALAADPGTPAVEREVALRPNRCDAHALGEDKQGTYFDIEVTLPGSRSGQYSFGVDRVQRAQLYGVYSRMCGFS